MAAFDPRSRYMGQYSAYFAVLSQGMRTTPSTRMEFRASYLMYRAFAVILDWQPSIWLLIQGMFWVDG